MFRRPGVLLVALGVGVHGGCEVGEVTCYNDHSTGRNNIIAGSDNIYAGDSLTQEWCAQLCHDRNATLAGVDSSDQCYCGNALSPGAEARNSSECNFLCTGSRTELCGGDWRQGVFAVNCSGAPEPPPAELPRMVNPCRDQRGPFAALPFCDGSLADAARVADMLARFTLEEKISNLGTNSGPVKGLGLVAYNW
jgi:hypothetical protein